MLKYFDTLKKCPLFNQINKDELLNMLKCLDAKVVLFDKKETIFAEDSRNKNIGIVLTGSVQIEQIDYYGNRNIIGMVEPTEMFGEEFVCAQMESVPVSYVTKEQSNIILINGDNLLHPCGNKCDFHQQMILNLTKDLAKKTIDFHQKIEIISKRTTREKLMAYLMSQSKLTSSNSFKIPFDRQELADFLKVDRSGLSVEISKLKKAGIIDCRKSRFKLLNL